MSNIFTETKIELVTEAVEALVLASVVAATCADPDRKANHQNVVDAREVLKGSLRELLTPTLRVVADNPPRVAEVVPYGGKGIDGMNLA